MARQKIYKVEYIDQLGTVREETTIRTETRKEAMTKAERYKMYVLQYPGPGKYRTVLTVVGKL